MGGVPLRFNGIIHCNYYNSTFSYDFEFDIWNSNFELITNVRITLEVTCRF